jgi:hypothetical protein
MRSYIDIIIDVREGKKVEYEELRVALLFCRDMLFFTESALDKFLDSKTDKINPLVKSLEKKSKDNRFYNKKNPLEIWWGGLDKIPQEL